MESESWWLFTRALRWSLPSASWMQSTLSVSIYSIFILIYSSHAFLDLTSGLFFSDFSPKMLSTFIIFFMHECCPSPSILREEHELWSSSLCNFPYPTVTSSFLIPNILSFLFSSALSLHSHFVVRGHIKQKSLDATFVMLFARTLMYLEPCFPQSYFITGTKLLIIKILIVLYWFMYT
jgi:hypothetical protein